MADDWCCCDAWRATAEGGTLAIATGRPGASCCSRNLGGEAQSLGERVCQWGIGLLLRLFSPRRCSSCGDSASAAT